MFMNLKSTFSSKPPNTILLICTREIGDVLLTTPLLHSLALAYPQTAIDVLVFMGKGGLLQGNADIRKLIEIPERPDKTTHWALIRRLWRGYDLAVSTLPGDRPLFYAWFASRYRIAPLQTKNRQNFWKHAICQASVLFDDDHTHTVMQNLRLADCLGIKRHYAVQLPQTSKPYEINLSSSYVVLHCLPRWQYKRWSAANWISLANQLKQQFGYQIVLSGGPDVGELAYLAELMPSLPEDTVNLGGKLDFAQLSLILSGAKLYVGPDTAVTHLAAATGVATVALFGPTNPLKWSPLPQQYQQDSHPFQKVGSLRQGNVYLLQGEHDQGCVPCHQEGCERHRASHSVCLDNLSVDRVIHAIQSFDEISTPC